MSVCVCVCVYIILYAENIEIEFKIWLSFLKKAFIITFCFVSNQWLKFDRNLFSHLRKKNRLNLENTSLAVIDFLDD